jgi:tungstate transport system substrate-binding protein
MLARHHAISGGIMRQGRRIAFVLAVLFGVLLAACAPATPTAPQVLRLATTTSTADSGLLDAILPVFEKAHNAKVDVVAVGSGQAIEIGKTGDADVLLVHSPKAEAAFVADGYGVERFPVMFNDFVLVGPHNDPAGITSAASGADALQRIADSQSTFISRGDDSGTNTKELALWDAAGLKPGTNDAWYQSIGQGMGETLQFANEQQGYTLSDRGTYLSMAATLPDLMVLFGGSTIAENPDPAMRNPYGVIQVKPADPKAPAALKAEEFIAWLTSVETQDLIQKYGVDKYGQPLFYPSSKAWCEANGADSPGCSS